VLLCQWLSLLQSLLLHWLLYYFKFKSLVATVVVVAFVVAFDEPMMPFGSLVATLLPFSCLTFVLLSLPQEMQLFHFKT